MKKNEKIKLSKGKSKAFVFANLTRENVFPCAKKLVEILLKNKIETFMVPKANEFISIPGIKFSEPEEVLSDVDIVFIVGGDGTILRAAKFAIKYDKPIIGINAGRLGFLSDIEAESLSEIEKLFKTGCPVLYLDGERELCQCAAAVAFPGRPASGGVGDQTGAAAERLCRQSDPGGAGTLPGRDTALFPCKQEQYRLSAPA